MAQGQLCFLSQLVAAGRERQTWAAVHLPPRLLLTKSKLHEPAVSVNVLDKSMNIYENEGDRGRSASS